MPGRWLRDCCLTAWRTDWAGLLQAQLVYDVRDLAEIKHFCNQTLGIRLVTSSILGLHPALCATGATNHQQSCIVLAHRTEPCPVLSCLLQRAPDGHGDVARGGAAHRAGVRKCVALWA